MTDYNNNDTGALFPDDSSSNRDHNGSAEIVCPHCGAVTQFWMSAWDKTSRAGNKFLSLAFTKKEARQEQKPAEKSKKEQMQEDGFDDDIPF